MNGSTLARRLAAGAIAFSFYANLAAADVPVGALKIEHPWSPAPPPGAPTLAGYMTITNTGSSPDTLQGASAPVAKAVEIHQETTVGGVMRIRPVTGGLTIPPHGSVTLAPGGYHLMLIGPRGSFRPGAQVPVSLRFSHEGEVRIALMVEPSHRGGGGSMPGMRM